MNKEKIKILTILLALVILLAYLIFDNENLEKCLEITKTPQLCEF